LYKKNTEDRKQYIVGYRRGQVKQKLCRHSLLDFITSQRKHNFFGVRCYA